MNTVKPPKYYDKLYEVNHYTRLQQLKKLRKIVGEASLKNQLKNTTLTKERYLEVKEGAKLEQIKNLKRGIHK